jgi:hypothetical protein
VLYKVFNGTKIYHTTFVTFLWDTTLALTIPLNPYRAAKAPPIKIDGLVIEMPEINHLDRKDVLAPSAITY